MADGPTINIESNFLPSIPQKKALTPEELLVKERFIEEAKKNTTLRPEIRKPFLQEETADNNESPSSVNLPPTPEESLAAIEKIRANREARIPKLPSKEELRKKLP